MTEIKPSDTQTAYNLAARVTKYVESIELTLLEEEGLSVELGEQIAAGELYRQDYSPIFKEMTKADIETYNKLFAEITAASQLEVIGGNFSATKTVTDTYRQRAASPAIRIHELLISVAIRENLMDEEDLISLWSPEADNERDVALLEKYEAPVLAHIVRESQPHIF